MVNYNGNLHAPNTFFLSHQNRAFTYADALVERLRLVDGKLVFWEDHYFRLMASMRMLRMRIPMEFTMEFLEDEIRKTLEGAAEPLNKEITISVFRNESDTFSPMTNDVSYLITTKNLAHPFFVITKEIFEVEIFKDFYKNPGLLSSLCVTDHSLAVVASVFAQENSYDDCILVNTAKNVIGTTGGNVFLVKGNTIKTPPLTDGANNGIVRMKSLDLFRKWEGYSVSEDSISPFELQKADELFMVNDIFGVQPITKYRKKQFTTVVAQKLMGRLNAMVRLG